MEINSNPDIKQLPADLNIRNQSLTLQLNQRLDAEVIEIGSAANTLILNLAGKTFLVESQQPLSLKPGQSLQLQVVKLQPEPTFNIIFPLSSPQSSLVTAPPLEAAGLHYLNLQTPASQPTANQQVNQMDINLSLDVNLVKSSPSSANNPLNLTLNQVLIAKVIDTQIVQNTIALSISDKTVLVQAQPVLTLQAGQSLQLQVIKLLPTPEFKVIPAGLTQTEKSNNPSIVNPQRLKLLNQSPNLTSAGLTANRGLTNLPLNQLANGQQLQARLLNSDNGEVSLEILTSAPSTTLPLSSGVSDKSAVATNPATTEAKQTNSLVPQDIKTSKPANPVITLNTKQLIWIDTESSSTSLTKTSNATISQLPAGSRVILQVLKPGSAPIFSVSLPEKPANLTEQDITQLFKQLLPIQASPSILLNQLNQNLPILSNIGSVAETLKQLAHEILAAIPPQAKLSEPGQLKQSIGQSGLFLEAKLAEILSGQSELSLQEDMKVKLVKFVALLKLEIAAQTQQSTSKQNDEILKDILQKTNGALAKLTLDQFNSLPRDESFKQNWVLELPFFFQQQAHSVEIEIEQDKQGAKQQGNDRSVKNWAVSITITPPEVGTIYCKVSCYDGAINTRFWSDTPSTVANISDHLDYLKTQFEQKGLKTGFMEAHQGKPSSTQTVKQPLASLLNEKA